MVFTWPWEVQDVLGDAIGMAAMLVLGGIIAILGIIIMTGKIPLPGGAGVRLLVGLMALAGGGYILWGVATA